MSSQYRWPPGIDRAMERALESLRRQFESPAFLLAQRHLADTAQAFSRQLENSAVESVRRYLETVQEQQLAFEVLEARLGSPVVDALTALDVQQDRFRLLLQQTIAPLPDVTLWRDALGLENRRLTEAVAGFQSLSRAVEQASLLWCARLPQFEAADEELGEEQQEELEEEQPEPPSGRLVKIIPVRALQSLESVDLLPLRVLDQIYRTPKAIYELTPRQFELLVAELLEELGFQAIELTPRSGDRGRDVVAMKSINGIPLLFAFECKRHAPHRKVGVGIIRSLLGAITQSATRADVGVLVTTATFTRGAQSLFLTEARVKGRDFNGVLEWINEIQRLRRGA